MVKYGNAIFSMGLKYDVWPERTPLQKNPRSAHTAFIETTKYERIMAEKISKHCWATPKCGIRTAEIHFHPDLIEDLNNDFQFVIVRNPYFRVVSFYLSKVVNSTTLPGYNNIAHLNGGHLDMTFSEVVPLFKNRGERHIASQCDLVKNVVINFVRCEHWVEDMRPVCDALNIDHNKYGYVWENRTPLVDTITEYVGDKKASWFRDNGMPSDYSLFYTEHTKQLIYDCYKEDFDWLNSVYDTDLKQLDLMYDTP